MELFTTNLIFADNIRSTTTLTWKTQRSRKEARIKSGAGQTILQDEYRPDRKTRSLFSFGEVVECLRISKIEKAGE